MFVASFANKIVETELANVGSSWCQMGLNPITDVLIRTEEKTKEANTQRGKTICLHKDRESKTTKHAFEDTHPGARDRVSLFKIEGFLRLYVC